MAKKIICKNCQYKKDGKCTRKVIIEISKKVEKIIDTEANKTECKDYVQFNDEF